MTARPSRCPSGSAASRSARSFGVIAETGRSVSGRLTPLRSDILPPITTRVTARSGEVSSAISRTLPSSSSSAWPGRSAARISGCGSCTRLLSPGVLSESRMKLWPFLSWVEPLREGAEPQLRPLQVDQDADRPAVARSRHCGWSSTSSRILSCGVWLMLMRNTSAPASNSLRIIALSEEAGPRVARILIRRSRLIVCFRAALRLAADRRARRRCGRGGLCRPGIAAGLPGPRRPGIPGTLLRLLFVGFGQLDGPCALLAGVDLEKAGAVIAARQAVLGALDGEFLVARAHEGLAGPFAAAIIVEGVDVIVARDEVAAQQGLADCATTRSTSLRWSSPRRPCSRARCRPGWRCCCRAGNRRPRDSLHRHAATTASTGRMPAQVRRMVREAEAGESVGAHAAKLYQIIDDFACPAGSCQRAGAHLLDGGRAGSCHGRVRLARRYGKICDNSHLISIWWRMTHRDHGHEH